VGGWGCWCFVVCFQRKVIDGYFKTLCNAKVASGQWPVINFCLCDLASVEMRVK